LAFALGLACGEPESEVTGAPMARPEPAAEGEDAGNRAPQIDALALSQPSPRPGETVAAEVRASDPDGDTVSLSYVWRIDGEEQPEKGASFRVSGDRSSQIELEVTPRDGKMIGAPKTITARIGNQVPVIHGIRFQNNQAFQAGADLVAEPQVVDADGDSVELTYRWYVNDELVDSATGAVLPARAFKVGDRIRLAVSASDGVDTSSTLEADAVTVDNAAPRITSDVPASFDEDGVFRYQVVAEDPEGGALRYRLLQAPSGMTLDPIDGRLVWTPSDQQRGKNPVELEVIDARGAAAVQSFALNVDFSDPGLPPDSRSRTRDSGVRPSR
jgi:hypothetical protein